MSGTERKRELEIELSRSSRDFFTRSDVANLRAFLLDRFGQLTHAFIIECVPEQGEELITVVVSPPSTVLKVQTPRPWDDRTAQATVLDQFSLNDSKTRSHYFSKQVKRKLSAVVQILSRPRVCKSTDGIIGDDMRT